MTLLLLVFFFILGLIIGSFLNVVIYRINTAKSFGGRSACMSCEKKLRWYELIPLFSFLFLKGRCRTCKTRISIQYPLVELATGLIFALLFLELKDVFYMDILTFGVTYDYYAVMFSILMVIAVYDLKHKIIPDSLSLVFGIFAFIGLFFFTSSGFPVFYPHIPALSEFLSGILIASPFAFFWLISSGKWMGLGDAKLALGIGWLLGLSIALSGLVIAFWSGAIIGVILIIFSKSRKMAGLGVRGIKSEIPFAPFLVLGTFLAFIFELNLFGI